LGRRLQGECEYSCSWRRRAIVTRADTKLRSCPDRTRAQLRSTYRRRCDHQGESQGRTTCVYPLVTPSLPSISLSNTSFPLSHLLSAVTIHKVRLPETTGRVWTSNLGILTFLHVLFSTSINSASLQQPKSNLPTCQRPYSSIHLGNHRQPETSSHP